MYTYKLLLIKHNIIYMDNTIYKLQSIPDRYCLKFACSCSIVLAVLAVRNA